MSLDRAICIAANAHFGQSRKGSGLPYIIHPLEVMTIVASVDHTPAMLIAAVLHDVVEDTEWRITDIYRAFGLEVQELVWAMTDQATFGNRAIRKEAECRRWAQQCPEAQTIKLADLISNTKDILEFNPKFAPIYLREKQELLKALHLGHPLLHARAEAQVLGQLEALNHG